MRIKGSLKKLRNSFPRSHDPGHFVPTLRRPREADEGVGEGRSEKQDTRLFQEGEGVLRLSIKGERIN